MTDPTPFYRTGKICYLEIPSTDIAASARFYQRAFGWEIRSRDDGSTAFDDTVGGVSGIWVVGPAPAQADVGIRVSIMVADAAASLAAIVAAGGTIVQPVNPAEPEVYALFADPSNNVLCIYQQPGLDASEAADVGRDGIE